jgi:hypothetical protein
VARGADREAVAHLEQALVAVRPLPGTREATELTIDIHFDLRNAFSPFGDWAHMREHSTRRRCSPDRLETSTGSGGLPPSWRYSASSLATMTGPSVSGGRALPSHAPLAIARSKCSQRPISAPRISTAEIEGATDQDWRQAYSMLMFGNGRNTALAVAVASRVPSGSRKRPSRWAVVWPMRSTWPRAMTRATGVGSR